MQEEAIHSDPVFIGLTRPAMILGLPYSFAMIGFFIAVITFIATASFWAYLVFIPLYPIGLLLVRKDVRFIDLYWTKISRCPRTPAVNRAWWGGVNSYAP